MHALKPNEYHAVKGTHYRTPKEVWGFRTKRGPESPTAIATEFLRANAALLGLQTDLEGISRRKIIESLGAFHVIFSQKHLGVRIHRAYVTVHVDREGSAYLAKNRAVPKRLLAPEFDTRLSRDEAVRAARRSLKKPTRASKVLRTEPVWFPKDDTIVPAWQVRVKRLRPAEEWIVYVNARSGAILSKYDNLALVSGRALIFNPSPVTALGRHETLITKKGRKYREQRPPQAAYVEVTLLGLSTSGYLEGKRVTTRPTKQRVRSKTRTFQFESHERGFEEVMVYYHIDNAIRYLEELGYRGRRAIFRSPVEADVRGTREDNSWYSPESRRLTFGTGEIDDAEDAETILHELGHAIQDAIIPDFGQSEEAAAMGEGFGDYFAGSYFEQHKPKRYRDVVMTWDGLIYGLKDRTDPPALRRLNSNLTYRDLESGMDEHDSGLIWSATLWDIRRAVGRRTADILIIESHFQLDGFTTFDRGARAIMDADTNLYQGRHLKELRRIFSRRGIGPV